MTGNGLTIRSAGRGTRLKWHRLRRYGADPEFGTAVLEAGLQIGASMELDLRHRADGGFVVLHDDTLERETIGQGPVAARTGAELARLIYRQSHQPLILSEGLAGLLRSAHPEALLQFNMKDSLERVGAQGVDHLADHFGDANSPIIFSGDCADLIAVVGTRLPNVLRGIDPTDRLLGLWRAEGLAATEATLIAEIRGRSQPHMVYLSWQLILQAARAGLDLVALCHAYRVQVDAWTYTLADPAQGFSELEWVEFGALVALGVDQITTDEAIATEAAWIARQLAPTVGG